MLSPTVLVVILVVVGVVLCAILTTLAVFKVFVNSRQRMVKVLSDLRYLPVIIVEKEVIVDFKKKLTKRQLRRKRMREVDRELRAMQANHKHGEQDEDLEDTQEEGEEGVVHTERSIKLLNWVIGAFSKSNSSKVVPGERDVEFGISMKGDYSMKSKMGSSSKSEESSPGEGSSKSKRFISQDRLQRKEARMLLVRPKSTVAEEDVESEEEDEHDNVVSLLSLAVAKKRRIADIMESRKVRKGPGETAVDMVALNAGPPMELVPKGYELVSQELGPALITPEVLLYKRILYLWDGSVGNIVGWHIGTIVGISENAGYNYRIKYDREETKSIFVDGIQPVFLSLSGEQAFGRRWVVMQKSAAVPAERKV